MQALQTMKILWASISFSTLIVLFVGLQAAASPDEPPPMMLLFALGFVSMGLVAASQLLPKQTLVAALKAQNFQVTEPGAEERMFNDAPRKGRKFAQPAEVRQKLVMCAQTPFILGLALSEAIALMGFVLLTQGFALAHVLGFFVVSWLLLASKFPRFESWRRVLEATYDAELGPG